MYLDFLKYYFRAGNAHSIHSPFVFEFYNQVLKNKSVASDFSVIEKQRDSLLSNKQTIERIDFGAGKKKNIKENISSIARTSLKPKYWGQFLFRLVGFYNYKTILDLGTSFGITTSYFAKANPEAKVYTFDGCPQTIKIAEKTFQNLEISNIESICGNLDQTLLETLPNLPLIDFVFFDANHKKKPTLAYFETCLAYRSQNACFVFDDIYWSDEMKEAWSDIKRHPQTTICIDLFYLGIVFFRTGLKKQDFMLK
ncbi:MAG TPA: class I SAM-dependent methyltransferase [Leadbetterella sp.]|nr:class I SAM-dependent methyltransferase [Leadbetterella sp.]